MNIYGLEAIKKCNDSYMRQYSYYKYVYIKVALLKNNNRYLMLYCDIYPKIEDEYKSIKCLFSLDPFYVYEGYVKKTVFKKFLDNYPKCNMELGEEELSIYFDENILNKNGFYYIEDKRVDITEYYSENYRTEISHDCDNKKHSTLSEWREVFDKILWESECYKNAHDVIQSFFKNDFTDQHLFRMNIYLPKYQYKIEEIDCLYNELIFKNQIYNGNPCTNIKINVICEINNIVIDRLTQPVDTINKFTIKARPQKIIASIGTANVIYDKVEYYLPQEEEKIELENLGYIRNKKLREIIKRDIVDAEKSLHAGSWKSTIVMCGSILEALLVAELKKRTKSVEKIYESKYKDKYKNKKLDYAKLRLEHIIDIAREVNVAKKDILEVGHSLRAFRNYIHPMREINQDSIEPTEELAHISINLVYMVVSELSIKYGKPYKKNLKPLGSHPFDGIFKK